MAKPVKKTADNASGKKTMAQDPQDVPFFERMNRLIIAIGCLAIIAGFYFLSVPPVNGFLTMYVAPVFLVIGFLVIVPIGIMYGYKGIHSKEGD